MKLLFDKNINNIKFLKFNYNKIPVFQFLNNNFKENTIGIYINSKPDSNKGELNLIEKLINNSHKYNVRDSFSKMTYRSLNNSINNFNTNSYSFYSFSSQNDKDLKNLIDIYFDNIFFNKFNEIDFLHEGWRFNENNNKIIYDGVMYNEMTSFFLDYNNVIYEEIKRSIYDDHRKYCNGGIPEEIINLKFEDIILNYKKNYVLENSKLVYFGKNENKFNFLENYKSKNIELKTDSTLKIDIKEKIKFVKIPIKYNDKNPIYTLTFYLDKLNFEEKILFKLLEKLLFNSNNSPFMSNIFDKNISNKFYSENGFENDIFIIGFDSVNDYKKLHKIIIESLNFFKFNYIEACTYLNEFCFKLTDIKNNNFINNFMDLNSDNFMNDNTDEIEKYLNINSIVNKIKTNLKNDNYFRNFIDKYFINNNNFIEIIGEPSMDYFKDIYIPNDWNLNDVINNNYIVEEYISKPEDKSQLPCLDLNFINNKESNKVEIVKNNYKNINYIIKNNGLNNIIEFKIKCNLKHLSQEEKNNLEIIKLFFDKLNYEGIELNKYMNYFNYLFQEYDFSINNDNIEIHLKFIYSNFEQGIDLISQIINNNNYNNIESISKILKYYSMDTFKFVLKNPYYFIENYWENTNLLNRIKSLIEINKNLQNTVNLKNALINLKNELVEIWGKLFQPDCIKFEISADSSLNKIIEEKLNLIIDSFVFKSIKNIKKEENINKKIEKKLFLIGPFDKNTLVERFYFDKKDYIKYQAIGSIIKLNIFNLEKIKPQNIYNNYNIIIGNNYIDFYYDTNIEAFDGLEIFEYSIHQIENYININDNEVKVDIYKKMENNNYLENIKNLNLNELLDVKNELLKNIENDNSYKIVCGNSNIDLIQLIKEGWAIDFFNKDISLDINKY